MDRNSAQVIADSIKAVANDAMEKGQELGRSGVAGAQFNLLDTETVAKVLNSQSGALSESIIKALKDSNEGSKLSIDVLGKALVEVADAVDKIPETDFTALNDTISKVSKAITKTGDESGASQQALVDVLQVISQQVLKGMKANESATNKLIGETQKNTSALNKLIEVMGADKQVEYNQDGQPSMLKVVQ